MTQPTDSLGCTHYTLLQEWVFYTRPAHQPTSPPTSVNTPLACLVGRLWSYNCTEKQPMFSQLNHRLLNRSQFNSRTLWQHKCIIYLFLKLKIIVYKWFKFSKRFYHFIFNISILIHYNGKNINIVIFFILLNTKIIIFN